MGSRTVVQNVSHNKCKLHPVFALHSLCMKCRVGHQTVVLTACGKKYYESQRVFAIISKVRCLFSPSLLWLIRHNHGFMNTFTSRSNDFAISVDLLLNDGNSRSSMRLLAAVQLLSTKLRVVQQDRTVRPREIQEDKKEDEERWGGSAVGGASWRKKRGRPKKTDATTAAMALWGINSPEPHCANLIGNVNAVTLCRSHTLASKWNE